MGPFFISEVDSRADFSWDMFSYRRKCPSKVCRGFRGVTASGRPLRIGWGRDFKSTVQIARMRYRERLARYAQWLCETLPESVGEPVSVYGRCDCYYGRPGPDQKRHSLIEEDRDYCEALP